MTKETTYIWADGISPMQIGAFSKEHTKKKNHSWVDGSRRLKKQSIEPQKTDLHSAFDQIEGNHSCVCGATAQNPTKATQDEILLRAELTTVSF